MKLIIRHLGAVDYSANFQAMKDFTDQRDKHTPDELWLLEHPAVFTQGLAGKAEHLLNPHQIPVLQSDRGGQITYHGPGQLMLYALCDLKRLSLGPRELVCRLERSVIDLLASLGIEAQGKREAPGVYVNGAKIASIGLRIRKGCSYHGLALNVAMDLKPFSYINPCGFKDLKLTQVRDLRPEMNFPQVEKEIIACFIKNFGYNAAAVSTENSRSC